MRVAVDALGQITAAMDPADWPSAAGPFNRLLGISLDARPKVRRAAHSAVAAALTAIKDSPAINPASQALLKGISLLLLETYFAFLHTHRCASITGN